MQKVILFSLAALTVGAAACTSDPDITFDPSLEAKPILIETDAFEEWSTNYVYNADGALVSSEDDRQGGNQYTLRYDDDRLVEVESRTMSSNALLRVNQVAYDEAGRLSTIDVFQFFEDEGMPATPNLRYTYQYDEQGRVASQAVGEGINDQDPSVLYFFWTEGEITRAELHIDGEVAQEYFYKYDSYYNYQRVSPLAIFNPVLWSDHNVVESELADTSTIDITCNPCVTEYKYNDQGFPVKAVSNGGFEYTITYTVAQ